MCVDGCVAQFFLVFGSGCELSVAQVDNIYILLHANTSVHLDACVAHIFVKVRWVDYDSHIWREGKPLYGA